MKLSEISRYAAAKELTRIDRAPDGRTIMLSAPFTCPTFTLRVAASGGAGAAPTLAAPGAPAPSLREVVDASRLTPGSYLRGLDGKDVTACFALPKGKSELRL